MGPEPGGTGEHTPCHRSQEEEQKEKAQESSFLCFKVEIFMFHVLAVTMPIMATD